MAWGVAVSDNIIKFYPMNAAENPDNVLEQAIGDFASVLIIGWDKDGDLSARASLNLKGGPEVLWLLEAVKFKLMNGDYVDDEE